MGSDFSSGTRNQSGAVRENRPSPLTGFVISLVFFCNKPGGQYQKRARCDPVCHIVRAVVRGGAEGAPAGLGAGRAGQVSMFIQLSQNETLEQFSDHFVKQSARGKFRFFGRTSKTSDWYAFCINNGLQHEENIEDAYPSVDVRGGCFEAGDSSHLFSPA